MAAAAMDDMGLGGLFGPPAGADAAAAGGLPAGAGAAAAGGLPAGAGAGGPPAGADAAAAGGLPAGADAGGPPAGAGAGGLPAGAGLDVRKDFLEPVEQEISIGIERADLASNEIGEVFRVLQEQNVEVAKYYPTPTAALLKDNPVNANEAANNIHLFLDTVKEKKNVVAKILSDLNDMKKNFDKEKVNVTDITKIDKITKITGHKINDDGEPDIVDDFTDALTLGDEAVAEQLRVDDACHLSTINFLFLTNLLLENILPHYNNVLNNVNIAITIGQVAHDYYLAAGGSNPALLTKFKNSIDIMRHQKVSLDSVENDVKSSQSVLERLSAKSETSYAAFRIILSTPLDDTTKWSNQLSKATDIESDSKQAIVEFKKIGRESELGSYLGRLSQAAIRVASEILSLLQSFFNWIISTSDILTIEIRTFRDNIIKEKDTKVQEIIRMSDEHKTLSDKVNAAKVPILTKSSQLENLDKAEDDLKKAQETYEIMQAGIDNISPHIDKIVELNLEIKNNPGFSILQRLIAASPSAVLSDIIKEISYGPPLTGFYRELTNIVQVFDAEREEIRASAEYKDLLNNAIITGRKKIAEVQALLLKVSPLVKSTNDNKYIIQAMAGPLDIDKSLNKEIFLLLENELEKILDAINHPSPAKMIILPLRSLSIIAQLVKNRALPTSIDAKPDAKSLIDSVILLNPRTSVVVTELEKRVTLPVAGPSWEPVLNSLSEALVKNQADIKRLIGTTVTAPRTIIVPKQDSKPATSVIIIKPMEIPVLTDSLPESIIAVILKALEDNRVTSNRIDLEVLDVMIAGFVQNHPGVLSSDEADYAVKIAMNTTEKLSYCATNRTIGNILYERLHPQGYTLRHPMEETMARYRDSAVADRTAIETTSTPQPSSPLPEIEKYASSYSLSSKPLALPRNFATVIKGAVDGSPDTQLLIDTYAAYNERRNPETYSALIDSYRRTMGSSS